MENKNDKLALMQRASEVGNTIGKKIAQLRKKKNLTQDELGELIGVSAQAVSKWEHGGVPDACLVPLIAETLGITTDELFGCHTERNLYTFTEEEFLDFVYRYCQNLCFDYTGNEVVVKKDQDIYFDMLLKISEAVFKGCVIAKGYSEKEGGYSESSRDKLDLFEIVTDQGTSFLTFNEDFRFQVTVKDDDGLSERLLDNELLTEFFAEFSDPNFLRLMLYVQSHGQAYAQYTTEYLARNLNIPEEEMEILCDKLSKYSFWQKVDHVINNENHVVFSMQRNIYFRSFLMLAYMMVTKGKYFHFCAMNRSKTLL